MWIQWQAVSVPSDGLQKNHTLPDGVMPNPAVVDLCDAFVEACDVPLSDLYFAWKINPYHLALQAKFSRDKFWVRHIYKINDFRRFSENYKHVP